MKRENSDAKRELVGRSVPTSCSPRFKVVSDLPEYTVWDKEKSCDLFPTTSGNRHYACAQCEKETAQMIADALNAFTENPTALETVHKTEK